MTGTRHGWVVGAVLLAVMAGLGQTPESAYTIGSGDVIEVLVPRYPEFSKQYPVGPDGTIALELVGAVLVKGLTTGQIGVLLADRLAEYLRHPQGITVRIVARRMTIRVLGQVASPGLKEASKNADVQELLALAGGPTLGALVDQIEIRRRQGEWVETLTVDLKAWLEGRGQLPALADGDTIFVPRLETEGSLQTPLTADDLVGAAGGGRAVVLGSVKLPGEYPVREDHSLLSLLNRAGGWTPDADLGRVRRVPGGEGAAELIDLRTYLIEGGSLPQITAGDVISVPSLTEVARTIKVLGAVARPGSVALPAGGDLQTAIAAAGGPGPQGDLRQVRVRRADLPGDGETVDLEAYLESGDAGLLPPLRDGDVVFVPQGNRAQKSAGAVAYVFGAVARPGPYALAEDRALLHLLAQAGGPGPFADLRSVLVTHHEADAAERAVRFDLEAYQEGGTQPLPDIHDGDTVTVPVNRITVVGSVVKPGPLELPSKATVADALAAAGGPREDADLSRLVLSSAGDAGVERQVINLEQYLYEPGSAPPMPRVRAGDVLAVEAGAVDDRLAYVMGAVVRPGVVTIPGRQASVLYALAQVGGPLPTADTAVVRILRPGADGLASESFDLKALLAGESVAAAPQVRPGDVVSVLELSGVGRGVLVLGAVVRQGRVDVEVGQNVIDTIGKAGGTLPNADPRRARLLKKDGGVVNLDLTVYTKTGQPSPLVEEGDVLVIASVRDSRTIWDDLLQALPFLGFFLR
jgi:protein involved in polysaccharide export with SLBB domain